MPIIKRMKKNAEMSAMGEVLSFLVDVRDTGMRWRKLQGREYNLPSKTIITED